MEQYINPKSNKSLVLSSVKKNNLNKSQVKQMINSAQLKIMEPKSFDIGLNVNVGNGGTVILSKCTTITQGDTDTSRDGDQLYVEWSEARYNVIVNSTDVSNVMRVIVFCWHFDDGGQPPTASLILQAPTTPLSSYNRDSVKERAFTVLSDKLHAVYAGGIGQISYEYKNLKKFKITYTAGGTTGKNQIYVLAVSDSAVSPFPILNLYHRTQFLDA